MQSSTQPDVIAGGVDQRTYPAPNTAAEVLNFRYHSAGGWRNDRGWEPMIKYPSPFTFPDAASLADALAPCRFLNNWTRHAGSEEYAVQERNGNLFYEFGNKGITASGKRTLATGRHNPRSDEVGTQMIPYGRFALFINGHDRMIKWWGRKLVEQFGFTSLPPAPSPARVQVDYNLQNGVGTGDGRFNHSTGIALAFSAGSMFGLGDPAQGSVNNYSYRVSYITNTGSESPLSDAADIGWTLLTGGGVLAVANARKYGVLLTGLEPGPSGTVARNIYRTRNKKDGIAGAGDIYYFCKRLNDNTSTTYLDHISDAQLVSEAPNLTDSVAISSTFKYGAAWNGLMWLAGGDTTPTLLRYSKSGLPEQFGAFDYFDLGVRDGGAITALFPFYNVLLVFREKAIDAVSITESGFSCTTIKQSIGTIATESIRLVPDAGVIFLNKNGFYLITGGLQGGATFDVNLISSTIEEELGRVSVNSLCRATAVYSDREKEYWCHYPVDGGTENTRGAVFNTLTKSWSFRGSSLSDEVHDWRFTKLAIDNSGWIIMGTLPSTSTNFYPGFNLQIWSARRSMGDDMPFTTSVQNVTTVVPVAHGVDNCIWQSTWNDFGDDSVKKRVISIELDSLTEGNATVELQWAMDYDLSNWKSAGFVQRQRGEVVNTTAADPTFDTGGNIAVWDTSKWQNHKVTRFRWDVNTGLVSHFAFRIITNNVVQVIKFQTNFIVGQVKSINTLAPGARR